MMERNVDEATLSCARSLAPENDAISDQMSKGSLCKDEYMIGFGWKKA
jgi:hypothetical protein